MFAILLQFVLSRVFLLALHLESGSFPRPLNSKEEKAAFERYRQGDKTARDELIQHNLRLVAHIVKKYYAANCAQDDLISIGTIGLIKAVDSFVPAKGARFSTYAARCIENEILMQFRSDKKTKNTVSLHDTIDNDKEDGGLSLGDMIADNIDLNENYETKEEEQALYKALQHLDEREQKIICMRYGLHGQHTHTQQQVARQMGISRSYVSRIETKALQILREVLQKRD